MYMCIYMLIIMKKEVLFYFILPVYLFIHFNLISLNFNLNINTIEGVCKSKLLLKLF